MSLPKPYYEDEARGILIYHADCREILPLLPKVDLLLTDPPYGVMLGSHADAKELRAGVGLKKQAYLSYDDTHSNLTSVVVPAVTEALAKCSRGIVFAAGTMMWDFPRPDAVSCIYIPCGNGRTKWGFQNLAHFMLYGTAPDLHLGASHTAMYSTEASEKNGHPCPKPLGWIKWLCLLGSRSGETVLDPFMGSGTTLVACKQLGRRCIGIELEEKYCEIAARRLSQGMLFGQDELAQIGGGK